MLRFLLIGVVLLVCAVTPARAQQRGSQLWYQAYEAGVRDVNRGAWDAAVQNLTAAKQSGPRPARRVVFYGDRVDAFNPDYYLGVAYLNLRRFADADAAFERVRQANVIAANDALFRMFQTYAATAKFELVLGQAEDYLAKGDLAQAKQVSDQATALGVDATRARAFQQRVADAESQAAAIQAAQQATQQNAQQGPPPNVQQAPPIAQALPPPSPEPPPAPIVQGPPVVPSPTPPGTVPGVQRTPAAKTPEPGGGPPNAPQNPITITVTSAQTGIAAYLAGRYAEAASLLAVAANLNPQTSARARFYLACSLAALVLTGERDEADLMTARAALQTAGRIDQFAADRRIVSPRVLAALGIQP